MLPMIELHDATGDLGKVPDAGGLLGARRRAEGHLQAQRQPAAQHCQRGRRRHGHHAAVGEHVHARLSSACATPSIRVPLVIDAPDFGKNLDVVVDGASQLLAVDPNLIFSVHPYWAQNDGASPDLHRDPVHGGGQRRASRWSWANSPSGAPSTDPTSSICEGKRRGRLHQHHDQGRRQRLRLVRLGVGPGQRLRGRRTATRWT